MASNRNTRGEATREALILAALEIFGRDGFQAASTRAIAGAAGVNQALIGFHFGGKKELYIATFGYVTHRLAERIGPLLEDIEAQLRVRHSGRTSTRTRLERWLPLLHRVTDALVVVFTSEESRSWARLILREQQDPSEAFEAHYDESIGRIVSAVTGLVARALDRPPRDRQVRLLVFTIIGQALIFRAASATVVRHLGRQIGSQIGRGDTAAIQALIRRNTSAILKAGVET